jgi:hypothetical protein
MEKKMFELVVAAGFDLVKLEFMQAYDIEGNIIRDEQLRREFVSNGFVNGCPRIDREEIIRSMSEADRAALRARVQI